MMNSPYFTFTVACLIEILTSCLVNLLSYSSLIKIYKFLKTRSFERGGKIYQDIFRVKLWKDYVPAFGTFDKKHISTIVSKNYMATFLLESIRAELVHLFCIITTTTFFLLSHSELKRSLLLFFLLINIPCIIIQRYNRPRFERILSARGGVTEAFLSLESELIRSPGRR